MIGIIMKRSYLDTDPHRAQNMVGQAEMMLTSSQGEIHWREPTVTNIMGYFVVRIYGFWPAGDEESYMLNKRPESL